MTGQPKSLRELLRAVRRELRDERIRAGELTPQTHREMRIWLAGIAARFGLPATDDTDHAASGPVQPATPPRRARDTPGAVPARWRPAKPAAPPPDDHPPDAA